MLRKNICEDKNGERGRAVESKQEFIRKERTKNSALFEKLQPQSENQMEKISKEKQIQEKKKERKNRKRKSDKF